jgi:hypothetical protein
LRPDIKIELTFSDILLPINELKVKTLIEDNFEQTKLFIAPITKCISINETAIEKWVGLTRRIMAIERGREDDDKTLIRQKLAKGEITLDQVVNLPLKDDSDVMNVFSLAISMARLDSVERMLGLFDKESINNTQYFAWGWGQKCSFMEFAVHSRTATHDILNLASTFPYTAKYTEACSSGQCNK